MSSGFSTLSKNVGIGVPMSPVASRVAISFVLPPPRKVHGLVRFAGLTGFPQSSFSSGIDGPSARPAFPWHLLHSIASNISLPRFKDASDEETSFGRSTGFGASLKLSGAKLFTYATRFHLSFSGRTLQGGIEVPGIPSVIILKRSRSDGALPDGVVRILYFPWVKSLGLGSKLAAPGPFPSPFSPWQRAHFFS